MKNFFSSRSLRSPNSRFLYNTEKEGEDSEVNPFGNFKMEMDSLMVDILDTQKKTQEQKKKTEYSNPLLGNEISRMTEDELTVLWNNASQKEQSLILTRMNKTLEKQKINLSVSQVSRLKQLDSLRVLMQAFQNLTQEKSEKRGDAPFIDLSYAVFDYFSDTPEMASHLSKEFLKDYTNIQLFLIQNPEKSIVDYLNENHPEMVSFFIANTRTGFATIIKSDEDLFKDATTESQALRCTEAVVDFLRSDKSGGHYELARQLATQSLEEDFEAVLLDSDIDVTVIQKEVDEIIAERFDSEEEQMFLDRVKKSFLQAGYSEEESEQYALKEKNSHIQNLKNTLFLRMKNNAVGHYINKYDIDKSWSLEKKAVFQEYADSIGAGWMDISDESWDFILKEVAINAPLIVLTGGLANAGVKVLSIGGRMAMGTRTALAMSRVAVNAPKIYKTGTLITKVGSVTLEAGLFNMIYTGLRYQEWFMNEEKWVQNLFWTTVTLGTFKGVHAVSKNMMQKSGIQNIIQKLSMGGGMKKESVEKILAMSMGINMEAGALFCIGAAQHMAIDDDSFWESMKEAFGDDIMEKVFHAYITAGALRVAHGGMKNKILKRGEQQESIERKKIIKENYKQVEELFRKDAEIEQQRIGERGEQMGNRFKNDAKIEWEKNRDAVNNKFEKTLIRDERRIMGIENGIYSLEVAQKTQEYLKEAGYYKGKIDKWAGEKTQKALKECRENGYEKKKTHERENYSDLDQRDVPGKNMKEKLYFLYQEASETKPILDNFMAEIGKSTNGESITTDIKGLDRMEIKVNEDYKGRVENLRDVARGTIEYKNIQDMQDGLQRMKEVHPDIQEIYIKNRMGDPFDLNIKKYPGILRDYLVNVRFKNGHVGEIQFKIDVMRNLGEKTITLPEEIYEKFQFTENDQRIANEIIQEIGKTGKIELPMGREVKEHDLYEIKRAITENSSTEQRELGEKINDLQIELYRYTWKEFIKTQSPLQE